MSSRNEENEFIIISPILILLATWDIAKIVLGQITKLLVRCQCKQNIVYIWESIKILN
jgi:hypothetical protein